MSKRRLVDEVRGKPKANGKAPADGMTDEQRREWTRRNFGGKPGGPEPPPPVETFTAADLMKMRLPAPRWAVEGVLPVGLSFLAGKPKLGKSWMALNIAVSVATGGVAFGSVAVEQGDVLYLALEDTKRRLQDRLDKLLRSQNAAPPERLTLATEWPQQDNGGLTALMDWLAGHKEARLVVVDTRVKFKPRLLARVNEYEAESRYSSELKAVADQEGLAVLGLTHCRKSGALDPLEEIMGSIGLSGAADCLLVLRRERGQLDASLHVTGRDVEEKELALAWNPEHALWSIVGDADEFRMSKERADVVSLLAREGRPLTPTQVAKNLGKKPSGVKSMLCRMAHEGQLKAFGDGTYWMSSNPSNPSNRSNPSNPSNREEGGAVADPGEASNPPSNRGNETYTTFPE